MISKEVISDRKAFYLQEAKIELKNATDYLHAHCDNWKEENERVYTEILNRAAMYADKALAMEELLNAV
jgi:hypothetical protein